MGNVNSNPLPTQQLGRVDRRTATAERVENHVAGVGGRRDDPLNKLTGFCVG